MLSSSAVQVLRLFLLLVELMNDDADVLHQLGHHLVLLAVSCYPGLGCLHLAGRNRQNPSQMHQRKELEGDPYPCLEVPTGSGDVMQVGRGRSSEHSIVAVAAAVVVALVEEIERRSDGARCLP